MGLILTEYKSNVDGTTRKRLTSSGLTFVIVVMLFIGWLALEVFPYAVGFKKCEVQR